MMVKIGRYLTLIVVVFLIGCGSPVSAEKAVDNMAVINGMPVILPDPAVAMDWYDMQVVYNLYSTLIYPTPEGTVRPHLAQDWEAVDGKLDHWRFTLRRGAKFHDGSELTAEDVVFSMNRFMTMGKGLSGVLGKVTATAVSKYVVDFILEKPNSVFPEILKLFSVLNKDLVLKHIQPGKYEEFGDYGEDWLMTHDAGSGPYIMVSHTPGERMEAKRFKEYFLGWESWGPDTEPIERLIFIMESETATLIMLLKSGRLDLEANGAFSRLTFKDIRDTEGIHINPTWPQVWTVWMNTRVPPTDDVHFRRAILYAYDYEAVLEQYAPFGAQETGVYPSTLPGYIEIPPQPRRQDLEKAREELALSKYDPAETTVVFHYCGGLEAEKEICLQLQADFAKLGVKVEVVGPAWPQYEAECTAPETTPNLSIFMFPLNYPSPDSFIQYMYHPDNVGGIYASHWYAEEELGQLIDRSRETLDFNARLKIYRQIQEKVASQVLAFYPYEIPALFTSQDYLIGPKETFPLVGPTINMHNWRINLTLKQESRG
ncbi:MAG: ABC transporter substrate-binding protein [Candidatus Aerophobetes bacterium]|nr:ABC transporter substrate-binding protein [Candidatus Aerophobetes bacterium]